MIGFISIPSGKKVNKLNIAGCLISFLQYITYWNHLHMQTRSWFFVHLPAFHLEILKVSAAHTKTRTPWCDGGCEQQPSAVNVERGILDVLLGLPSSTCFASCIGSWEESCQHSTAFSLSDPVVPFLRGSSPNGDMLARFCWVEKSNWLIPLILSVFSFGMRAIQNHMTKQVLSCRL